jgi:hypothetical protein
MRVPATRRIVRLKQPIRRDRGAMVDLAAGVACRDPSMGLD